MSNAIRHKLVNDSRQVLHHVVRLFTGLKGHKAGYRAIACWEHPNASDTSADRSPLLQL